MAYEELQQLTPSPVRGYDSCLTNIPHLVFEAEDMAKISDRHDSG
jgi:hypothetical protein